MKRIRSLCFILDNVGNFGGDITALKFPDLNYQMKQILRIILKVVRFISRIKLRKELILVHLTGCQAGKISGIAEVMLFRGDHLPFIYGNTGL